MIESYRQAVLDASYLLAAILFVFGLKRLRSPASARSGNRLAAAAMALAIAVTFVRPELHWSAVNLLTIAVGLTGGAVVGLYLARTVKMTAMPQMVALFNGMGGATAALVSLAEFTRFSLAPVPISNGQALAVVIGTGTGALSLTGSLLAVGKLQELLSSRPVRFPLHQPLNLCLFLALLVLAAVIVHLNTGPWSLWLLCLLALLFGVLLVLPIGGADMPVVIAVLNSVTGLATAATGFTLRNQILIVAGALVGASGSLLTLLMSRAMNRPLANVLFGAFGSLAPGGGAPEKAKPVRTTTPEDAALALAYANQVIIIPGYGLAVAQAQHQVRELADELTRRGVPVKYAIHPVAGRMPGHMNVLLAEANVPYDELFEMDQINAEFERADVALVVGANDVVNPAARSDPASPIYGMPILNADKARMTLVLKRSLRPGFAGIENELFHAPNTLMLFGDAKDSLTQLIAAVKTA